MGSTYGNILKIIGRSVHDLAAFEFGNRGTLATDTHKYIDSFLVPSLYEGHYFGCSHTSGP